MADNTVYLELGQTLQSKREALNISTQEISQKLNIKESYLYAIEAGEIDKTPSKAYFLGFMKSYSHLLGTDFSSLKGGKMLSLDEDLRFKTQDVLSGAALLPSRHVIFISALITICLYIISYSII